LPSSPGTYSAPLPMSPLELSSAGGSETQKFRAKPQ
jgi:hypothetical protein